jgi:type IV fimbrial biogenesis protein FimT
MFGNRDRDAPAIRDPGEPLLQRFSVNLHNQVTANRHSFSFRTTALRATNGTFLFCDRARRASPRALIVSYTGRPRVGRIDRNGKPYTCPDYVKFSDGF